MPQAKTIAVAGKGGSGKSTVSALLVSGLVKRGFSPVLAVDADPDGALGWYLGAKVAGSVGELKEQLRRDDLPQDRVQMAQMGILQSLAEHDGFDILTMGRGQGPGCYCSVNDITRRLLGKLAEDYPAVVVDNEAGLEHLSRGLPFKLDLLAVVTQPEAMGVMSAKRIVELSRELGLEIAQYALIVNEGDASIAERLAQEIGLEKWVAVPYIGALDRGSFSPQPPQWSELLPLAQESIDRIIDWATGANLK
jgi:CO dehydrogenase maturation factor